MGGRARRYPQLRTFGRRDDKDVPLDEMDDMRSALDELDIRLRAMQQREALREHPVQDGETSSFETPEGSAALRQIRAQTEHLRAQLQLARPPTGLLNINRSLFNVDDVIIK